MRELNELFFFQIRTPFFRSTLSHYSHHLFNQNLQTQIQEWTTMTLFETETERTQFVEQKTQKVFYKNFDCLEPPRAHLGDNESAIEKLRLWELRCGV